MKALLLALSLLLEIAAMILPTGAPANPTHGISPPIIPQPTTCITSRFSSTDAGDRRRITLRLTNRCGKPVDFQNSTVTFLTSRALNTRFSGSFDPLSYPDNDLRITSQPSGTNYLASLSLHFPTTPGSNSVLPADMSIRIRYYARRDNHIGSANVYLSENVSVGNIQLTNASAQPTNVAQTYALVHISMNGQNITDVQLPWSSVKTVTGLATGNYNIAADNVTDSNGNVYQGEAAPATVTVVADQTVNSTITYTQVQQAGKLAIQLQALPTEIAGYTGKPIATLTQSGTGSSVPVTLTWGASSTVEQLKAGSTYSFSTPVISFNGYNCQPTFNPGTLVASDTSVPSTNLTYVCSQVAKSTVTLNVSGAPTTLASLKITLTPNDATAPVTQVVTLNNGSGSSTLLLTTGTIYTVSSDPVTGYRVNFNPQPLTATANAIETITLTPEATGTPVAINGQLTVCGTHLCNEHNQPIQLRGMSSHGIQWYGWQGSQTEKACLTTASLDTLAITWGASVMRISMYIQEGGYETNPAAFTSQVNQLIDEATKRGIYAIVDWHMLEPGDPNYNLARAKTFFTAIATAHKNNNNLLYEIANEPSGVSWSTIKSYADQLIPVIRAIDPKTPILIGTRAWSSLGVSDGSTSQEIINNPVNFPNIMYTFHFYAASHKDEYYNELDRASNVLPIFVTEFGTQTYTGDGNNDFVMSDKYLALMAAKKIGWTNWNYSDDFRSGAVWKTGTCSNGPWTDANLKPAGVYVKAKIKG